MLSKPDMKNITQFLKQEGDKMTISLIKKRLTKKWSASF